MQQFLKTLAEWPIVLPLLLLLKSEKFMIAVITLLVDWGITQIPQLAEVRSELILVTSLLGGMLIVGRWYETLTKGKIDLTPFLGPIVQLLKSRKFMIAVITLLVDVLIAGLPDLEPVRNELMAILTVIGTALIGAIAYEDGTTPQAVAQYSSRIARRFETVVDPVKLDLNEGGGAFPGPGAGTTVEIKSASPKV